MRKIGIITDENKGEFNRHWLNSLTLFTLLGSKGVSLPCPGKGKWRYSDEIAQRIRDNARK